MRTSGVASGALSFALAAACSAPGDTIPRDPRPLPVTRATSVVPELGPFERVRAATGSTPEERIVSALEEIRAGGSIEPEAARRLGELVAPRSPLLEGRDASEVPRLRAWFVLTLLAVGRPEAAAATVRDVLAHPDESVRPLELGAAIRAAGTLGGRARSVAPQVLHALAHNRADVEIGLDRLSLEFDPDEATTVRLEAIRALPALAAPANLGDIRRALAELAIERPGADPRVAPAARAALAGLAAVEREEPGEPREDPEPSEEDWARASRGPWIPADERIALPAGLEFVDQDGRRGRLEDLLDRPTALGFFYTRCGNAFKCTATVRRLGELQAELAASSPGTAAQVVAVSYEPAFDTPERIRRYAGSRGVRFGADAHAIVLADGSHDRLVEALTVGVSYQEDWVNLHAVELFVLDARGRLARRYTAVGWDNAEVAEDLARLASER